MKCPLCNLEGRITATRYIIENDNNDKPTELFYEMDIKCNTKTCDNYDKVFTTVKTPVKIG